MTQELVEIKESENQLLSMMERLATTPNMSVDILTKMIDLQERVLDRNARMEYMAEFARMQPELPAIAKKGAAHNDKKYAKYEDIVEAVRPVIGTYGFGFSHKVNQTDAKIEITCTLTHRSGYSESTQFVASADASGSKNAVQAVGSTIAYGKRYTLLAILGISTKDEDDDGNNSSPITKEQAQEIEALIKETKSDKVKFLYSYMGIEEGDISKLLSRDFDRAKSLLLAKRKAQKDVKSAE